MNLRKRKFLYLSPFILSIAITAMPLLMEKWIGLEKSLYFMYTVEFALGIGVATYIYKEKWKLNFDAVFLYFLIFIFIIEIAIYVKREPNFGSFHLSKEHILPYIFTIIIIPFYEECIYRGCLVDFFREMLGGNIIWAMIFSSVIFSGMHTQYTSAMDFIVLFFVSIIFSFSRIKSGSLLPPLLLHSIMNAFVLLLSNLNVF